MESVDDDWTPASKPECTSSLAAPIFDMSVLAANIGAIWFYDRRYCTEDPETSDHPCLAPLVPALALPVSLVYFISGVAGLGKRSTCKDAERRYRNRALRQKAPPVGK